MVKNADIIEDFFETFSWKTEEIYDEIHQKQIELSMVFLKNMYGITFIEFNITKKTSEDFMKMISEKIKNIQKSVFELNCSGEDVLVSLKSLYDYLLKTYIKFRSEEFGAIFDKWAQSGHISGGTKIKEKKEEKYKEEIYKPFLVDWKDGEYDGDKSYHQVIEDIKEQNSVGNDLAKKMYKEASKVRKRIKKKVG